MGAVWTEEQKKAIKTRDADIIVSAAAGSGKTAVLVERIMRIVTNSENPVDIDNLLVVTFTSAAAAEMKERISAALTKLADETGDEHILRQLTLINRAYITTIHSFCAHVVRDNYIKLNIDPDFRVADETECALIKNAVVEELFEEKYGLDENKWFLNLVEALSEGTGNEGLKNIVLGIYQFIQSMPFPNEYLSQCVEKYDFSGDFGQTPWGEYIKSSCRFKIKEYINCIKKAVEICLSENGPSSYIPALYEDINTLSFCAGLNDIEELSAAVRNFQFVKLGRKGKNDDKDKADAVKLLRDIVKKGIDGLKESYFFMDINLEKADLIKTGETISSLAVLVKEFDEMYTAEKRQRAIADFNDLEHLALKALLVKGPDGKYAPSGEAAALSEQFYEVMTDEYQDSNPVQEMILFSVSGRGKNQGNRFMVGDVKQSIYRFRQAEPNIFLNKYNSYGYEGEKIKIDLFKNFRSRRQILDGVNFVFRQIMSESLGEMEYSTEAWLYSGADYPETDGEEIEIDIIDKNSQYYDSDDAEELSSAEAEMAFVCQRIEKLFKEGFQVYDRDKKEMRPLKYGDIAIIMRKTKNWGQTAYETLSYYGIPAFYESGEGYFERREISDMLSLLNVIDNARQDIPLMASLKLPSYGLDDEELLRIKMTGGEADFYTCLKNCADSLNDDTAEKINRFFNDINRWKEEAPYISVGQLLWDIYDTTGYYDYCGMLKNGALRQANLMLLVDKAAELEKNNFRGLFNFIRYVERMLKNGADMAGAKIFDENADVVRIMTVHKSKGLEFPVVFLCGTGNRFNKNDMTKKIVMHRELGMACDFVDLEKRVERPSVSKKVILDKIETEDISEEMRVLYVAMTRAKEKLIITGTVSNIEKKRLFWAMFAKDEDIKLPCYWVSESSSFLDWLCCCAARHMNGWTIRNDVDDIDDIDDIDIDVDDIDEDEETENSRLFNDPSEWKINIIPKSSLLLEKSDFEEEENTEAGDETEYPFEELFKEKPKKETASVPANMYVSEIKRVMDRGESDELDSRLYDGSAFERPKFLSGSTGLTAAQKGTAAHTVLRNMDFKKDYDYADVKDLIEALAEKGVLSKEEAEAVRIKDIVRFAKSPLYERIKKSAYVRKETPFAMEMSPYEIFGSAEYKNTEGKILVHGMTDCFFEENDSIVLVDYKTDFVEYGLEDELKEKYKTQLLIYKRAVELSEKKPVKEVCLFALRTGKEVVY